MSVARYEPRAAIVEADQLGWRAVAELAAQVSETDFVPASLRHNTPAVTACILYGAEIGLGPMQSLSKIAVIDGRPTVAAETQRALIIAAGHDIWIEELTVTKATIAARRAGQDTVHRFTWTQDDTKRAGLAGRPNHQRYPTDMNLARASARMARAVFPDVIGGLAATEELEDAPPNATGGAVVDAEDERQTTRKRRRATPPTLAPAPPPPLPAEPSAPTPDDERPPLPHEEDPEPDPEPPVMINRAQQRKIFALMNEVGLGARAARLAWSAAILGRPLASSNDITSEEASHLIEVLEATPKPAAAATFTSEEAAVVAEPAADAAPAVADPPAPVGVDQLRISQQVHDLAQEDLDRLLPLLRRARVRFDVAELAAAYGMAAYDLRALTATLQAGEFEDWMRHQDPGTNPEQLGLG